MKKLLSLLSCLLLYGCGEKPSSEGNTSESGTVSDKGEPQEESVSAPISERITKEFILALWDKPHSDKDLIDELRHRKAGRWAAVMNWEGEEDTQSYSGASKFVDGRFDVTRANGITAGKEWVQYDVVTYDSSIRRYRKFTLGSDGKITEDTGRLYWRNLTEWRPIQKKGQGVDWVTRETFRDENYLKGRTEVRENGERVRLGKFKVTFIP